jgi:hypothetical protein
LRLPRERDKTRTSKGFAAPSFGTVVRISDPADAFKEMVMSVCALQTGRAADLAAGITASL